MNWLDVLVLSSSLALGFLAQHYKGQRDDLAALVVTLNPELFSEHSDESPGSGDHLGR